MSIVFSPRLMVLCIASQFIWLGPVMATQYNFDKSMFRNFGDVDINQLSNLGGLPGRYYVDVYLNERYIESIEMDFISDSNSSHAGLSPCLAIEQLERYGVKVDDSLVGRRRVHDFECANISAIPKAKAVFDVNEQVVNIKVPQAYVQQKSLVDKSKDPSSWNDGVPGGIVNYRAIMSRYSAPSYNADNYYLNLQPGFNTGPWRVRSSLNANKNGDGELEWNYVNTYAERGLGGIKSRLWLGETYTRSSLFDSVPVMGAVIKTDEEMLPAHMREKSPSVRGYAAVDSTIEIRQSGDLIYSEVVSAGPYEISNIQGSYSSGELEVTVLGGDGSREVYTVPYSRPAIVLPENTLLYSASGGFYRSSRNDVERMPFGELTLAYGTPWDVTLQGGAQYADKYKAISFGSGVGLGFLGDISVDSTVAIAEGKNKSAIVSQRNRARYNKFFDKTGSSISIDSSLYSKSEFLSLSEVMETYRVEDDSSFWGGSISGNTASKKWRSSVSLSQTLNKYGSFQISAVRDSYYNGREDNNRVGVSYSKALRKIRLSLNYDRSKVYYQTGESNWNNLFGLSLSMPVDLFSTGNGYLSYNYQRQDIKDARQDVSLYSNAFDKQLAFGVRLQNGMNMQHCDGCMSSVNGTWYGKYAELGGGYSYSENSENMNASIAGGILLHQQGITFGQPTHDVVGLVSVNGADDVSIMNGIGVRTDSEGSALVNTLSAYRVNEISLDPASVPDDTFLNVTDKKVIPTKGAIVPIDFPVVKGGNVLITLKAIDARKPPFGAVVTGANSTGYVDQDGRVFMYGLEQFGTMQVRWGEGQQCSFSYDLEDSVKNKAGIYEIETSCI
ncbi:fimbrial biogenesis outer membrane usher protein [Aeromonas jandaei]|uniref:fimbria/pilus outer membrane usher protein n=1 Tax=Aeromonas jandaei TaxID=650 RepID=UPI00191EA68E|nr:fimbria/pilus outer membrane usher protein [Aeromonas jandaei]MBL0612859.1 fimbrial biogenesis outer membrane usher protein [Aeromonas jandaei]